MSILGGKILQDGDYGDEQFLRFVVENITQPCWNQFVGKGMIHELEGGDDGASVEWEQQWRSCFQRNVFQDGDSEDKLP